MLRHTMPPLSILLIGETQRDEFRDACAALAQRGRVAAFAEIESAAESIRAADGTVDLVVIAQTYPGQFSAAAVDRLRRLCPVARVVGLLGTWCEGETRTGKPWPGGVRVLWHQWPARAERELRCLSEGRASAWSLPATATDEERLLAFSSRSARGEPSTSSAITAQSITRSVMSTGTLVAICTRSWAIGDWLSAACRACGHATVWLRGPQGSRVEGRRPECSTPRTWPMRTSGTCGGSAPCWPPRRHCAGEFPASGRPPPHVGRRRGGRALEAACH